MSAASRRFWLRVQRRAAEFAPEVRGPLMAGFRALADRLDAAGLERLIAQGRIDYLVSQALNDAVLAEAFQPLRMTLREGLRDATRYHARDVPLRARTVAATFDTLAPQVTEALRRLDTRVMAGLSRQVRETVREHIAAGIEAGVGPRTMAVELRAVLPLAPNQAEAVRNFRRAIERQEGAASPFAYELRDRRYDGTLRAGEPLTTAQVRTMTDAYRRRMIAFNAETTARTAALDTMKEGNRLAWENAADAGVLDGMQLQRTWRGVLDDRERPEHVAMEGETVPMDEPYSNGQMVPGDDEYNCRCVEQFSIAA